jgi:hypothetical protein
MDRRPPPDRDRDRFDGPPRDRFDDARRRPDGRSRHRDHGPPRDGQRHARPHDGRKGHSPDRGKVILAKFDKDKDGKISQDEFAAPTKKRFKKLDANSDGSIDARELAAKADHAKHRKHGDRHKKPRHGRDDDRREHRRPRGSDDMPKDRPERE